MSELPARQHRRAATDPDEATRPEPSAPDRPWWTATVDAYLSPVYRFVRARVPAEVADDLVQETFVAAAKNAQRFDAQRGAMWPWLVGIARNKIAAHYRQAQRDSVLGMAAGRLADGADEIEQRLADESPLPEEICQRREFRDLVRAALAALEPRYQACLAARYDKGESLEQIGQWMDLSPAAVNSLLYRAREQLRRALSQLIRAGEDAEDPGP